MYLGKKHFSVFNELRVKQAIGGRKPCIISCTITKLMCIIPFLYVFEVTVQVDGHASDFDYEFLYVDQLFVDVEI